MTLMEATGGVLDPGTSVRCITCFGTEISGKVAAFDLVRKALVVGEFDFELEVQFELYFLFTIMN